MPHFLLNYDKWPTFGNHPPIFPYSPYAPCGQSMPRPNFFLSLRLNSPQNLLKFSRFYQHVTSVYPQEAKHLIPPSQVHLTLFPMHLGNNDDLEAARICLHNSRELLQEHFLHNPPDIHLRGIGTFGFGRVVYAKIEESPTKEGLKLMVKQLRTRFEESGLVRPQERFDFQPHATLMKTRVDRTQPKSASTKIQENPGISREVYRLFEDTDFGVSKPKAIELSSMLRPKVNGYYQSVSSIAF